jgi:hypothetical protein
MSIYCFSRIIYHLDELEHLLLFFFSLFIYLFFPSQPGPSSCFGLFLIFLPGIRVGGGEGELGDEGGKMTEEENAL